MRAQKFILARCADYNGHKDVLFMMEADDFRLTDALFSANYTILDDAPTYDWRTRRLATNQGEFLVCSDWSLKPLA